MPKPTPTADVDGLDAADKIAILACLGFGGRVNRENVYCEGIRQISAADINYAEKLGFTIKLLAIAQGASGSTSDILQIRVHPTLVPQDHPLASINGVNNAILVEGDPLGRVMFYGPGAGEGPTASAVVSDILNIAGILTSGGTSETLDPLLSCTHQHECQLLPIESLETRFYARFLCEDISGVIGHLGMSFGKHAVSLESVVQIGIHQNLAEIVVVTHDVNEGNFRKALAEIRHLPAVNQIPSILRVL